MICQETPSDRKPRNYIKWPGNIHLDTSIHIISPYISISQNINIKIPISNRTVSTHIKKPLRSKYTT